MRLNRLPKILGGTRQRCNTADFFSNRFHDCRNGSWFSFSDHFLSKCLSQINDLVLLRGKQFVGLYNGLSELIDQ